MVVFKISDAPSQIKVNGQFDDSCNIALSNKAIEALEKRKLKIELITSGLKATISNLKVTIKSIAGNIKINVSDNNATVYFGNKTHGIYNLELGQNSRVHIDDHTTSNGVRIICDNSEFICGEDCMFSSSILIQTAEPYGLVDLKTGKIINNDFKSVILGKHVWLGRQCTLTPDVKVGNGSIIGTEALLTMNVGKNSIAAGVPARVIKSNYTWCRSPNALDDYSQETTNKYYRNYIKAIIPNKLKRLLRPLDIRSQIQLLVNR